MKVSFERVRRIPSQTPKAVTDVNLNRADFSTGDVSVLYQNDNTPYDVNPKYLSQKNGVKGMTTEDKWLSIVLDAEAAKGNNLFTER